MSVSCHSCFVIRPSFVIRRSTFVILSSFRQRLPACLRCEEQHADADQEQAAKKQHRLRQAQMQGVSLQKTKSEQGGAGNHAGGVETEPPVPRSRVGKSSGHRRAAGRAVPRSCRSRKFGLQKHRRPNPLRRWSTPAIECASRPATSAPVRPAPRKFASS